MKTRACLLLGVVLLCWSAWQQVVAEPAVCNGDCFPFTLHLVQNGDQDPRVVKVFEEAHAVLQNVVLGQRLVAQPMEMTLYYRVSAIDGVGGRLGSSTHFQHVDVCTDDAVPCNYDVLPSVAESVFDSADFFNHVEYAAWKSFWIEVVLHEMLHVLGVGSFWVDRFPARQGYNARVDCVEKSFASYKYPGATREWQLLGGNGAPPVEYNFWNGAGSNCKHWDESKMTVELMTSATNTFLTPQTKDVQERLSKVTLGAMEDLNYVVDWNMAESYVFPSSRGLAELETQTESIESVHEQRTEYLAELELAEYSRREQMQRALEREQLHSGIHRGMIGEVWYPETYRAPLLDRSGRVLEHEHIDNDHRLAMPNARR